MRDDINEFVRMTNDPALGEQLEYELVNGIWQPIRKRSVGAVNKAFEALGQPDDPSRRNFLEGLGSLVGLSTVGAMLFGAVSAVETGVQLYRQVEDEREENLAAARRRYAIRSEFAEYIALQGYGADDIRANAPADMNVGEKAVLNSIEAYREFRVTDLHSNMSVLKKAVQFADNEDSADGEVIALARLMADSSFLGDGKEALHYSSLAVKELANVNFKKVRIRALDVATTITLNTMSFDQFANLNSVALEGILDQWNDLVGATVPDATAEDLYAEYGIESTGALQQIWLRYMKHTAPDTGDFPSRAPSDLRNEYFEQLLDKTLKLIPAHGEEVARDFFYSLHRLTFQVAASNDDLSQVKQLLDFYFGRASRSLASDDLNAARSWILRHLPGSTPWMVLLDVAYGGTMSEKRLRFSRLYTPNRKFPNQALTRAIIQVGVNLGYDRHTLEDRFGDFRLAQEAREMTISQAYTLVVCDRDEDSLLPMVR